MPIFDCCLVDVSQKVGPSLNGLSKKTVGEDQKYGEGSADMFFALSRLPMLRQPLKVKFLETSNI
ncbi:hypothetical protein [Methylocystis sp. ATCC 49242]|uniref:hypothetical protein n=1 Tax=Methylocystis sp. ATCC 49242 TaxID=622637 RepID=UPI0001F8761C|nr:hypothetical protein [Methylocystis sp. ATCC 49242]